jgi:hypothetical protein
MEKKRELVRRADVDELIDCIAGVTLTALSGLPARCAPRGPAYPHGRTPPRHHRDTAHLPQFTKRKL